MNAIVENLDLYLEGFWRTIQLVLISGSASLVFGTVLAGCRVSPIPVLRVAATAYVALFRNTPLLMIFVVVAVILPALDMNIRSFLLKACLAMTVYTSAFVCEAVRAGINTVPVGQAEASRAIGLTFGQSLIDVVLPQALRATIPPLASVMIAMIKNTSIAAVFGVFEATATMRAMNNNYADERIQIFIGFAIGYIVLVAIASAVATSFERKTKVA